MTDGRNGERRLAHERLSTGALARWMRACATHPWRVFLAWGGIVVLLVVLVIAVGGGLKDEFEIPGSDTQRATDLIESEFAAEQGAVLNLVFAAPEGETLDTPERREAIEGAIAELQSDEFAPTEDEAGIESVGDPFSEETFSDDGRIAYAEAQFSETIETEDRDTVVAVQDAVREQVEPVGVVVEFNGDAEFPPIEQGIQEVLGLLMALVVLLLVFRALVSAAIPIALASGRRDGLHPALHRRGLHRRQHDHAAPRVDDRARRRDRLLALHRHAVPAAPARGALARGCGRRGRRLRGARDALRRAHGRHLGERARVLRARLRDEARHRLALGVLTTVLMANSLLIAALAKLGHRPHESGSTSCSS